MRKQILLLSLTLFLLSSCVSYWASFSTHDRMKQIKPGMTQEEVISIVGNHYEIINHDERGCVLAYSTAVDGEFYLLYFERNILKSWNKEWFAIFPEEPPITILPAPAPRPIIVGPPGPVIIETCPPKTKVRKEPSSQPTPVDRRKTERPGIAFPGPETGTRSSSRSGNENRERTATDTGKEARTETGRRSTR